MKKKLSFLVILLCSVSCLALRAQSQSAANIIEELESYSGSLEGEIHVKSDPAITALIGKPNSQLETIGNHGYIERSGFRLQVYMGSDPSRARSEASFRQVSINEKFEDLSTYLGYDAPNWKLLAGDFITREEATVLKQQLQKEFPQFGKEIYIVVDKIRIPLEKGE